MGKYHLALVGAVALYVSLWALGNAASSKEIGLLTARNYFELYDKVVPRIRARGLLADQNADLRYCLGSITFPPTTRLSSAVSITE